MEPGFRRGWGGSAVKKHSPARSHSSRGASRREINQYAYVWPREFRGLKGTDYLEAIAMPKSPSMFLQTE